MIIKLLLASLGLISSMAYAESITTTTQINPLTKVLDYSDKVDSKYAYTYNFRNKNQTINFKMVTSLGQSMLVSSSSPRDEKCKLQIKDSIGTTELSLGSLPDSGVQITLLPYKDNNGSVETLIDLNDTKYEKKENSQKINENCSISNSISTTTSVRWLGDLAFDKEKTIKLDNGDEIYITISKRTKENSSI